MRKHAHHLEGMPDKRLFSGISPEQGPEAARRSGWGRGDGVDGRKAFRDASHGLQKNQAREKNISLPRMLREQEETSPQSAAILSRQPPCVTNGLRWGVSACECAYRVHGATTGDTETVEWQQVVGTKQLPGPDRRLCDSAHLGIGTCSLSQKEPAT